MCSEHYKVCPRQTTVLAPQAKDARKDLQVSAFDTQATTWALLEPSGAPPTSRGGHSVRTPRFIPQLFRRLQKSSHAKEPPTDPDAHPCSENNHQLGAQTLQKCFEGVVFYQTLDGGMQAEWPSCTEA